MTKNKNLFSNHNLKNAFSLIELSIVVLIIGILIAGVTQGSRLVTQSRLRVARNQTQTSSVASIPNVVAWFETTSENGINSATNGLNPENGDSISYWSDINPQSTNKVIVSNNSNQPTYVTNGINGLPSLKFNGTSQYLTSTIASGGNTPLRSRTMGFTFVAVWNKTNSLTATGDIFDQSATPIVNFSRAGFITGVGTGTYGFVGQGNDFSTTATYTTNNNTASIMTVNSSTSPATVTIYDSISSTPITGTTNGSTTTAALSNAVFTVGARAVDYLEFYGGLVSEIIIFDRVLKVSEINSIKLYLSQKYAIKMTGAAQ